MRIITPLRGLHMHKRQDMASEIDYYSKMIKYREIPAHVEEWIGGWLQVFEMIETPHHIFITDVKENGALGCEDLWLFSQHYAMKVDQFTVNREELEVYAIDRPITHMIIKATGYDFKDFDARSRLSVALNINSNHNLSLAASQGNCPILEAIINYLSTG